MPKVVVAGGTLSCPDKGVATLTGGASKLQIGSSVITAGMEAGLTFAHCTFKKGTVLTPCISVAATSGTATKLTVGGAPALLDSASGKTSNATTWTVQSAGQSKMESA